MLHGHPDATVCVCVCLQVFYAQLYPTWTGRPRTSTWWCFRLKTWGATWEDYQGPPPSPWGSPMSTTTLHASPRVSNSAAPTAPPQGLNDGAEESQGNTIEENDTLRCLRAHICSVIVCNSSRPQACTICKYIIMVWITRLVGHHLITTVLHQVSCQSLKSSSNYLCLSTWLTF